MLVRAVLGDLFRVCCLLFIGESFDAFIINSVLLALQIMVTAIVLVGVHTVSVSLRTLFIHYYHIPQSVCMMQMPGTVLVSDTGDASDNVRVVRRLQLLGCICSCNFVLSREVPLYYRFVARHICPIFSRNRYVLYRRPDFWSMFPRRLSIVGIHQIPKYPFHVLMYMNCRSWI